MKYFLFDIPRIFLEQKLISRGYFKNMNAFLRVNVTFYDAVNMIHDVISIPDPFPYTGKFMCVGFRHNKTQETRRWKINRIRT